MKTTSLHGLFLTASAECGYAEKFMNARAVACS